MTAPAPPKITELLIVSPTPQNLERGALWFKENINSIKQARAINPWWKDNTIFLEKDLVIKPAELARRLLDLGYERTETIHNKGLFAMRGGIVEIWPINSEKPYLIEFTGNLILEIRERKEVEEKVKFKIPGRNIEKLLPGSYVVHVDHGIGIFRGHTKYSDKIQHPKSEILNQTKIQNYNVSGVSNFKNWDLDDDSNLEFSASNFFIIEYATPSPGHEPDRLYVPTDQKDRLSPYVGFTTPTIHRLGGTIWQTTKRKVREDAEKLAKELLMLYAKREQANRPPYHSDKTLEQNLHQTFAYVETPDQLYAEEEIMKDMEKDRPMDRILCGDVGFGKTEIALRAALRAIISGKQVAMLTPTTILAAQHEKTFGERLKDLPVKIATLSRLTSPKDEKQKLKELGEGKLDCIIGTHRLLSKDIKFKNLGLLIIDEEQRFGVKQKEKFKELRTNLDILSLSATPIPRTLSLALAKLRDISLIKTPPPERVPIKTFVLPHSPKIIRSAVEFELARGGQIYFLHNRIETIEVTKERIRKITNFANTSGRGYIRQARKSVLPVLGVIHGRMKEKDIIKIMDQFRNREINILLATTIIENGLDISNANTIIVDDATRLGLAEAHQLRGRIGRGATQAFAYFLYKPRRLTPKAVTRLKALKEYSGLGSGYQIALRDLEIRGAGNILGREQSGAINKVGLNLYCQMLSETIEELRPN